VQKVGMSAYIQVHGIFFNLEPLLRWTRRAGFGTCIKTIVHMAIATVPTWNWWAFNHGVIFFLISWNDTQWSMKELANIME
jgi:hypothetical protein